MSVAAPIFCMVTSPPRSHSRFSSSMKTSVMSLRGANNRPNNKQEIMTPGDMLLAKMNTRTASTHEKKQVLSDYWKQIRQPAADTIAHDQLCGKLLQHTPIFQQDLLVKSFEIGPDYKMSIVALAKNLQETEINHFKSMGLNEDGFGSTQEMTKRDLVWIIRKLHIHVNRYPSWGDIVQVTNWLYESGKTGLRSDSIVSDVKTGEILLLASCGLVMMNKKTRKVSKFIEEAKEEIRPHLMPNCSPIVEDVRNFSQVDFDKTEYIHTDLKPGWNDLDVNQHVNNTKYVDWFLESTPRTILKTHELSFITLEYRKECYGDAVLLSLTREPRRSDHLSMNNGRIEFEHWLCLDSGPLVVRGRTMWKPR
ncbi:hypothetical protein SLA2020_254480 [Shorea laevis]